MRTIRPWASGGTGIKTDANEIGATTTGTGVADLTDAMTVRDMMIGIQGTAVTGGGMTGTIEVDSDETAGRGPGRRSDRDPGIGIMEGGGGLGRGLGAMATTTSDDGQITEQSTWPGHSVFYDIRVSDNSNSHLTRTTDTRYDL